LTQSFHCEARSRFPPVAQVLPLNLRNPCSFKIFGAIWPIFILTSIRLSGYIVFMKHEARFFKSLADETRLQILWLLMVKEELCVCDIMGVIGITQSKASRHLRYLYNLGLVADRRDGLWMYYRISVPADSWKEKQLRLLAEMVQGEPEAKVLQERLHEWLRRKQCKVKNDDIVDGAAVLQCNYSRCPK
jgi:ArsR family transcriptional regulator, arsenate/arsenite/antimonite-responsive transcriptional repressor